MRFKGREVGVEGVSIHPYFPLCWEGLEGNGEEERVRFKGQEVGMG